jgi:hypothetical protein
MNDKICSVCGGGLLNIMVIPASEAIDIVLIGILGGAAGYLGNWLVRTIINYINGKLW